MNLSGTGDGIDVDVDALDPREAPVPAHEWDVAKRVIREACTAEEHSWIKTTTYWRECRDCGIADVTAQAFGQDVDTPNYHRKEIVG